MRGFPELAESNFEIMNFPLEGTEQNTLMSLTDHERNQKLIDRVLSIIDLLLIFS